MEHLGSVEVATTRTLATTGSALLGSALTTTLGFGVLVFSPLIPFRQFGIVTGITILYALLVAVVVVPPLLVVWAAYHEWRRLETAKAAVPAESAAADTVVSAAASLPAPMSRVTEVPQPADDVSDETEEQPVNDDGNDLVERSPSEHDKTESSEELGDEMTNDPGEEEPIEG